MYAYINLFIHIYKNLVYYYKYSSMDTFFL